MQPRCPKDVWESNHSDLGSKSIKHAPVFMNDSTVLYRSGLPHDTAHQPGMRVVLLKDTEESGWVVFGLRRVAHYGVACRQSLVMAEA